MNPNGIVPLPGKTNVAIVAEQLEKLIADGFWKPEEKLLPEIELCRQFNVGRSTIREALNTMKARKLVYTIPGLGTFVAKHQRPDRQFVLTHIPNPESAADLLNIMELRLSLEPANAAFAAMRATETQLETMRGLQRELAGAKSDPDLFAEKDFAFHLAIAAATGNPVILDVMNMAKTFFARQQVVTSRQMGRRSKALEWHRAIIEAMADQDEVRAEQLMRDHMQDTYAYLGTLVAAGQAGFRQAAE